MNQILEIWTKAQKWMRKNENVKKKKEKNRKGRKKDGENEKDENKKLN